MKYMGWSWQDYRACPASIVAHILEMAQRQHDELEALKFKHGRR